MELEKALSVSEPEEIKSEVTREEGSLIDAEMDKELEKKADGFIEEMVKISIEDTDRRESLKASIENIGSDLQSLSSKRNQMLKRPIGDLAKRGDDGGEVANSLIELKMKVEDLDPNRIDFGKPGFIGRLVGQIPFIGSKLKRYFTKFEQSQTVIDAIINSLKNGKAQLSRDNSMLVEDQKTLRDLSLKLVKIIKLAEKINTKLEYKAERDYAGNTEMQTFIKEELIFPLRQRIMDLQQQLAVNQQGVIAIELIIRNNKELMRGVDRALHVTVNALQVAVTVALALNNQKIVLTKIEEVNKTTSNLIAATANRLRTQGAEIHKQASGSMLEMDKLKSAFADIKAAMNDISTFRINALPKMASTIIEFDKMVDDGEKMIQNMEKGNKVSPSVVLNFDE